MVSAKDVIYSYKNGAEIKLPNLELNPGEHIAIIGQSGAGKTTMLHLLAGILSLQKGSIRIDNADLSALPANQLDKFRGQNIGIVFQRPHFIDSLSVRENLVLTQSLAGQKADNAKVDLILTQLNLKDKADKKPSRLSQGEQQRVSIARAVINTPKLILADEPTSALDDSNCTEVMRLLKDSATENNAALIIVTHDQRVKDEMDKVIEI